MASQSGRTHIIASPHPIPRDCAPLSCLRFDNARALGGERLVPQRNPQPFFFLQAPRPAPASASLYVYSLYQPTPRRIKTILAANKKNKGFCLCASLHYPCLPKRTPVYPCVPLCTPVHPCVRTPVYCTVHRVQMNTVHRGTQGAGVHGGTRGYTGVHRGTHGYCTVPLRTHAYPCVPLCTPVYLRVSLPPLCLSSRRAPARENNLRRLSSSDRSAREGGVLTAPLIVLSSVRAGGVAVRL